jgi:hypothetical protein
MVPHAWGDGVVHAHAMCWVPQVHNGTFCHKDHPTIITSDCRAIGTYPHQRLPSSDCLACTGCLPGRAGCQAEVCEAANWTSACQFKCEDG